MLDTLTVVRPDPTVLAEGPADAVSGAGSDPAAATGRGARPRGPAPRPAVSALLVVVAVLALALAVAELVEVPGLSYSLMLGAWGLDCLVGLIVLTFAAVVLHRRHPSRVRAVAAVAAVSATAITGAVGARHVAYAHEHGVDVDLVALTGIGQAGAAPDLEPLVLNDVETGQQLHAGVWMPRDPGTGRAWTAEQVYEAQPEGVPVVVLLHGGGWSNGNRLNPMTRGQADWFARQGYLAIALDYPLSTSLLATWELAETRSVCGLAWVAAHAAQYGGDIDRLALQGDSAGGNLALEITYRQALGSLPAPLEECGSQIPRVDAVTVTYPVADPVGFHDNPDPIMGPFTRGRSERYTGGSPRQHPERYEAVDPVSKARELVQAGAAGALPPTLVVAGARDHVVPVAGVRELDAVLTQGGAPHETLIAPLTDHVFDLNPGSLVSQIWRSRTLALLERAGLGPVR